MAWAEAPHAFQLSYSGWPTSWQTDKEDLHLKARSLKKDVDAIQTPPEDVNALQIYATEANYMTYIYPNVNLCWCQAVA